MPQLSIIRRKKLNLSQLSIATLRWLFPPSYVRLNLTLRHLILNFGELIFYFAQIIINFAHLILNLRHLILNFGDLIIIFAQIVLFV